jgi:hypothetical protein
VFDETRWRGRTDRRILFVMSDEAPSAKPRLSPKHAMIEASMRRMGQLHRRLCTVPVIGEAVARALSWLMATFPWLAGMRRKASIHETRDALRETGEEMGFPFEFGEVEGDRFVLELPHCPYGFDSPEDVRPCATAMDMDRILLHRCGAELTIEETIPLGAARCRMVVRQR